MIGWGATRALPSAVRVPLLRSFARQYGIDVDEAEKPIEAYDGLQEFFTRRLRAGARPIAADPDLVVSPADGTVVEAGTIRPGMLLDAKDACFSLTELVADAAVARRLDGGSFCVTYLSPRDYHRVHTPVEGQVVAWHYVPGRLFPVNARSVLREPQLFSRNERLVTIMEGPAGLTAVVMVAAVGVGHITASYDPQVATHDERFSSSEPQHKRYSTPIPLARGQELGIFNLGSTTVIVFEPKRVLLDPIAPGAKMRMGAAVGRILQRA